MHKHWMPTLKTGNSWQGSSVHVRCACGRLLDGRWSESPCQLPLHVRMGGETDGHASRLLRLEVLLEVSVEVLVPAQRQECDDLFLLVYQVGK